MTHDNNKPNIVLDLDQTIISAEPLEEFNLSKYNDKIKSHKEKWGENSVADMDGYYIVFSRPYLQEFLDYIFENFNVVIWTAATKDYALFIIKHLILGYDIKTQTYKYPNRKIDFIFFSYHCEWSEYERKYTKELCMIWDKHQLPGYSQSNTVIIDDYKADVHKCQPNNCIIARAFKIKKKGSENDTFLHDLIPHLKNMQKRIQEGKSDLASTVNISMKTHSS